MGLSLRGWEETSSKSTQSSSNTSPDRIKAADPRNSRNIIAFFT